MKEYTFEQRERIIQRKRKKKLKRIRKIFFMIITFALLIGIAYEVFKNIGTGFSIQDFKQPISNVKRYDNSSHIENTRYLVEDTNLTDWRLILVNRWNSIPDDYEVELTQLSNGQSVDSRIYSELQEMFDAARTDNIYPIVASGYRTAEKQTSLMEEKIADLKASGYSDADAKEEAETWVAITGTSEHQLGIAVDINGDGIHSVSKKVYKWLAENSYKYGFILRYPGDKTDITGVSNEPWHYRYVGTDAAKEIYENGLCLEEYLEELQ
jgi:D-alanyl-D-alanine carboxypeptidase